MYVTYMKICLFFQDFRTRTSKHVRTAMKYRQQRRSRSSCSEEKSHWCLRLTPNNAKTTERMTCHCFLRPITRDIPSSSYSGHSLGGPFLASLLPTSPLLSGEGGERSFHIAQVCRVECGLRLALVLHHACRWSDFKKVFRDRCSIKLAKETHSPRPILQQTNNQHG